MTELWVEVEPTRAELIGSLASRRWIRVWEPFPHVVARNVFTSEVYAALAEDFRATFEASRSYLANHDLFGTTVTEQTRDSLRLFTSRAWHDLIARLLGIVATGHVNVGLHRHERGSSDGFPHNDLNPGWFAQLPVDGQTVLPRPDLVSYTTGQSTNGVAAVETVRAAAVLFYLENPPWKPGDGGATGLYRHGSDSASHPIAVVPPINNSLLAFACTPWSYHGFISNVAWPRNSIVMWLHQQPGEVARRFGPGVVVRYGAGRG